MPCGTRFECRVYLTIAMPHGTSSWFWFDLMVPRLVTYARAGTWGLGVANSGCLVAAGGGPARTRYSCRRQPGLCRRVRRVNALCLVVFAHLVTRAARLESEFFGCQGAARGVVVGCGVMSHRLRWYASFSCACFGEGCLGPLGPSAVVFSFTLC